MGQEAASYSSPTLTTLAGRSVAIFVTRLNVLAVDPKTGKEFFRFPFGKQGPTVNAATPLVFDNQLFVTASYGIGASLRKISLQGAQALWANDEAMSSQYSTCVHQAGYRGCGCRRGSSSAAWAPLATHRACNYCVD